MTVQKLTCPTCGRQSPVSQAPHLPFCTERCRLVDLGRWLEEEHALPVELDPDEDPSSTMPTDPTSNDRPPVRLLPGWHDA